MVAYSKLLPYSCYELGHTWNPSCSVSTMEVLISAALESMKIYGMVYLVSMLVGGKGITRQRFLKIMKDYLQSVAFLTVNGFAFIGSFCVLRHSFQHINFLSASWLPAAIASYLAILVERPSRRNMLAIYVTNIASECIFNILAEAGYVKPILHGEILLFVFSMTVFGCLLKSGFKLNSMVDSILSFFVGKQEKNVPKRKDKTEQPFGAMKNRSTMVNRSIVNQRHPLCPHNYGCIPRFFNTLVKGFGRGFLLHSVFRLLSSASMIRQYPVLLFPTLFNISALKLAGFVGTFSAGFQGFCCISRWLLGRDGPLGGALAGAAAGLTMLFYPSPSVALYSFWKALEALYEKGCDEGYLPRIPFGIELLYIISTASLFHVAVFHMPHMKRSYWRFMKNLTSGRIETYNRVLLDPYGLESGKHQIWPPYDVNFLSEEFKRKFSSELGLN